MIYFDKDKQAYGYEIEEPICAIQDDIWMEYAGTDKWDIIDGVFTDITNTPEYIAKELSQAKELKYQEANEKARNYLEVGDALYEFNPTFHVEASKENMNTLATAALAIEKGLIEYQPWTSKEDNQLNLTEMECLTISMGIGQIQSDIWNRQYMGYVTRIDNAQTVAEVNAIEIIYN